MISNETQQTQQKFPFKGSFLVWIMIVLVIAGLGLSGYASISTPGSVAAINKAPVKQAVQPNPRTYRQVAVTSLGRLDPLGEVTRICAPAIMKDERVGKLLVQQGDKVQARQVIAVLDNYPRLQAAFVEAQQKIAVAHSQLLKVKAGAKQGEIDAQQATVLKMQAERLGKLKEQDSLIERLQAETNFATSEFGRYEKLYVQGAISASMLDSKRTSLETTRARLDEATAEKIKIDETLTAQIQEAKATLAKIKEVRVVDVAVAQAELNNTLAAAERIKVDLELSSVRAPKAGRVLKIYTRVGETIGDKGIADFGQTDYMVAVAEVYESDIALVKTGQRARITGAAFAGELHGTVMQLSWKVTKQNVFSVEPGANFDSRVVEVKVLLDPKDSQKVAGLTNLQVQVSIYG